MLSIASRSLALVVFVLGARSSEAQSLETAEPDRAPVRLTQRWDGHIGVPLAEGGPPVWYAFWVDPEGNFAYRTLDGLPEPGPPERTGDEIEVPALAILMFGEEIQNRRLYDRLSQEDATGLGYAVQDGQLRLFSAFSLRSTVELLFVAGFLIVSGILLFVILRRLRREQAARREALEARGRMIRVREAERTVLAREIHDGPIQNLHALRLQAHAALLSEGITPNDTALEEGLRRISQELRSIMEGLRPPALDRFGFTAALESHAERVGTGEESVSIKVSSEAEQHLSSRDDDLQLGVFRVIQEAVSNAIQHGSQNVRVSVTIEGLNLVTRVSDNGQGFPQDHVPSSDTLIDAGHYGLVGMRERAEVLDGAITFGRSLLGGAEVLLEIPVSSVPQS
ncbi:MAG: hypothetical protein Rubg2KO_25470 [Rubricoccaceae bacterium]